jgi:hypothetical protein
MRIAVARWLLRIGLAGVLLYAAVGLTLQPDQWIGYLPAAATHVVAAALLLKFFALYQLVLAILLLSGWAGRYAAVLMGLTVLSIIGTNPGALVVTFRDVAILFAAAALAVLS